eukprot:UN00184
MAQMPRESYNNHGARQERTEPHATLSQFLPSQSSMLTPFGTSLRILMRELNGITEFLTWRLLP